MPDETPQLQWLAGITNSAVKSATVQALADQRKSAQDTINLRLPDDARAEIREALLGLSIKVKGKIGSSDLPILSVDGTALQEVDTAHHGPKTIHGLDPQDIAILTKQMDKIFAIQAEMLQNPVYTPPLPDFPPLPDTPAALTAALAERARLESDYDRAVMEGQARLAQDLWLPLNRQGIIPENFIPQQHSAVALQFKAASALYQDRLQDYSATLTAKDILTEKFEFGMALGRTSLKLMSAGTDLADSIATVAGSDGVQLGATEAALIMDQLGTALTVVETATTTALTDKDFTLVGDAVAATVSDVITGQTGVLVGSVISSATRGVRSAHLLKDRDIIGAAQALADGIAKGLQGVDASDEKWLTALGTDIQATVRSQVGGWAALETYTACGSAADVLRALITEFSTIADAVAKTAAGKSAGRGADDIDASAVQSLRADAARKQTEDMENLRTNGAPDFRLALVTGFAAPRDDDEAAMMDTSNRRASIDYILAVQAKNDATFALCKSIATKGVALVVKLCPGASLVESCMTLTFTIQETIAKAEELIIWQDNFKDAQQASSAQVDAFLNRKGLQTKQTLKAGIQVALDAAKVLAEALKLTPAAPVVSASIATTEALIEVGEMVATKAEMAAAWAVYVRARDNPADRYLARKATQQNPTLAKYAMAWGATKGDPIAVEGMRRCGLNDHTLALPQTNVAKVVAYLEATYADDPTLLRAVPIAQKWHPGPVDLTLRSWASFYQMATLKAEPAVSKTNDISGINAAFDQLDVAEADFATAVADLIATNKKRTLSQVADAPGMVDAAITAKLQAAVYTLRDMLRRFKSLDVDGSPHAEMAAYVDALVAKTQQRLLAIDRVLSDQSWASVHR